MRHIEAVWDRGKIAIDSLRAALGPDLQDVLCPLRKGGVSLHKLYGVMHDTCNCANKVSASYSNLYICFVDLRVHCLGCFTDA